MCGAGGCEGVVVGDGGADRRSIGICHCCTGVVNWEYKQWNPLLPAPPSPPASPGPLITPMATTLPNYLAHARGTCCMTHEGRYRYETARFGCNIATGRR